MENDVSVIGIGSPIVDLLARVPEEFLAHVPGEKGGMVMIDGAELRAVMAELDPAAVRRTPGGSAGNTVFDLARLGVLTALLGTVGKDAEGEFYRESLRRAGGSVHGLRAVDGQPTAACLCLVTPDAERTMRPALAAALAFDPASVRKEDFAGYALAHVEGYLLAHSEDKVEHLLRTAREAGCRVSLDLASFEVVRSFRPAIRRLVGDYVDIVFANSDEADALCGAKPVAEQLAELQELSGIAVLKQGEKGAWASRDGKAVFAPARKVRAVDTTAAGDSFAAGFLYGLLREWTLDASLGFGAAVAAETVQVIGAALPETAWEKLNREAAEFAARR